MKLVPTSVVSMVYSEKMTSKVQKPKFTVVEGCIYNQQTTVNFGFGGTANVVLLKAGK